jgi:putative Mn2+ efflux pump MntP
MALLIIFINRLMVWGSALTVLGGVLSVQILPLLLVAAALGTDAMSLSVGIGLRGISQQEVLRVSLIIGLFHIAMPLVGSVGGLYFGLFAGDLARWVGAGIVAYIGGRMIWGCLGRNECLSARWTLAGMPLLLLALSVSMDALSVGFSLGAFGYNIFVTSLIFGIFGGTMTAIGLVFGRRMGKWIGDRGELFGGGILIILALHMFFEG